MSDAASTVPGAPGNLEEANIFAPSTVIEGLVGVGRVELDFDKDRSIYVLTGTNGVGKTKTLEALFQAALVDVRGFADALPFFGAQQLVFGVLKTGYRVVDIRGNSLAIQSLQDSAGMYDRAVVYVGSQGRASWLRAAIRSSLWVLRKTGASII